jgi:hypothetical protein
MTIWLIVVATTIAVWWVERKSSPKATQAIVSSTFLSLRMALEAVLVIVLLHTTKILIGVIIGGIGGHLAVRLLEIGISLSSVVILVFDALRVRVKLNDLDAARLSPAPEIQDHIGQTHDASIQKGDTEP